MAAQTKLTPKQRKAIEISLKAGRSIYRVAKDTNHSSRTVAKIAHAIGIQPNKAATDAATQAHIDYSTAHRLGLINEYFDKWREILGRVQTPQEMQQLAMGLGIMIDKRRLEDGMATTHSITATVDVSDVRTRLNAHIDELSERRLLGSGGS